MFLINSVKWTLAWSKYPGRGEILISLRLDKKTWGTPFMIHCCEDGSIDFSDRDTFYRFDSFEDFASHIKLGLADIAWTELSNIVPQEDVSFF